MSGVQRPVVILYKHALLGEGIATYLRVQIGVEAVVASAQNPEAVQSALALAPGVVIFESSEPFEQFDLATLAPHAVLIDVSAVITRGSVVAPGAAGFEQILQAVRDSSSTVADPVETHAPQGCTPETHPCLTLPTQTRAAVTSAAPAR